MTDATGRTLRRTNTGRKSLSFLWPKMWSKVNPGIKNIKALSSFMHAIKKKKILHHQKQPNSTHCYILMIDIII